MLSEKQTKSANFLRIIMRLRFLRDSGVISEQEYYKAKKYYKGATGADIVISD